MNGSGHAVSGGRRLLVTAAKLVLAASIFAWMVGSGRLDPARVAVAFGAIGPLLYVIAALGAVVVLGALRWWLLMRAVGVALPLGRTFALSLIGCFFNSFLPGGVGGDAMRVVYVSREAPAGRRLEAATTVFIDRLLGLSGLTVLLLLGVVAQQVRGGPLLGALLAPLRPWFGVVVAVTAAVGVVVALACHPRLRRSRRLHALVRRLPLHLAGLRMVRTFARAVRDVRTLLLALAMSVVVHGLIASVFLAFGRVLGDVTPAIDYAVLVPLGMLVNTVPGPPQGLGLGEAAFDALFRLAGGGTDSVGGEACLAWRVVANGWNMVGGLVYVTFRSRSGRDLAEPVAAGYDSPVERAQG